MATKRLRLYEEVLLLALHDDKGTLGGSGPKIGLAAAALAELLVLERIDLEPPKNNMVNVIDPTPTGDPVLDITLARIDGAKRRAKIDSWVVKISGISDLHHLAARQLVTDGVLRIEEKKFLGLFTSTNYPELNPVPERAIIESIREVIFNNAAPDDQTAILIALADPTDLLKRTFTAKALRPHKGRIKEIVGSTEIGPAAKKAIDAISAAAFAGAMVAITAAN